MYFTMNPLSTMQTTACLLSPDATSLGVVPGVNGRLDVATCPLPSSNQPNNPCYLHRSIKPVIRPTRKILSTFAFLQRGRIESVVMATAIPSVRLPVTRWYHTQINEDRIMQSSLWDSKNTLDFWHQQWLGATSPSTYNLCSKWPTPSKNRRLRPIFAYYVSAVRASEKVQLSLYSDFKFGMPLRCIKAHHKITPRGKVGGTLS